MNRERAETHLRLLAEEGLRQVAARTVPGPPEEDPVRWTRARLARVAQALSSVQAMDTDVAEALQDDFDLAMTVRQPGGLGQVSARRVGARHLARLVQHRLRPPAAGSGAAAAAGSGAAVAAGSGAAVFSMTGAGNTTSGFRVRPPAPPQSPAPPQQPPFRPAPWRLVPVGRVIPIGDGDAYGELFLLAFAQTDTGARFIMAGWLDQSAGDDEPGSSGRGPHRPRLPSQDLTAVDDQGTSYRFGFSGGGSASDRHMRTEWEGALDVHPDPPGQIRWLDVTGPRGSVTRVDLDPRMPVPEVTVIQAALTPGEVLLDRIGAGLLVGKPVLGAGRHRPWSATGLPGDIIAALQAAEALPRSSPVPGQLAWLGAKLAGDDVTPPPAGVPEPWLSLLAYQQRRPPRPAPAFCAAAVTVELPEIDGSRFAILGLFNGRDGTFAYLLATGVAPDAYWPDIRGTGSVPTLWLRDHLGQWHTTRIQGFGSRDDGEVIVQLAIEPRLDRDTPWLELRATGLQEQFRTRLPLRWT